MGLTRLRLAVPVACCLLAVCLTAWPALAATRCYDQLGCYESLTLHALPQEPAHLRTEYRLACRGHADQAVVRATHSEAVMKDKIEKSCFSVGKPVRVITHGFRDSASALWVTRMRDAFLAKEDCNVITVDWHHGATFPYVQAVANSFLVARQLATLLRHLELVHGVSPLTIHLVGHSIGGHISGQAGSEVSPSRVARVTGLDPAEPYFDSFSDSLRLDQTDAIFVDVIHTDGEKFTGYKGYGSLRRQGHVDFYPNGGQQQPGCGSSSLSSGLLQGVSSEEGIGCSHHRAIELFLRSIETEPSTTAPAATPDNISSSNNNNNKSSTSDCVLWGTLQCPSWELFEEGNCSSCPEDGCLPLGFHADSLPGVSGEFYLSTSAEYPFCGQDYLISVHVTHGQKRAFGRLELVLQANSSVLESTIDFSRSARQYHSLDTESHVITTNASLADVWQLQAVFVAGSGIPALDTASTLGLDRVDILTTAGHPDRWSFCSDIRYQPAQSDKGSKQTLFACGSS